GLLPGGAAGIPGPPRRRPEPRRADGGAVRSLLQSLTQKVEVILAPRPALVDQVMTGVRQQEYFRRGELAFQDRQVVPLTHGQVRLPLDDQGRMQTVRRLFDTRNPA